MGRDPESERKKNVLTTYSISQECINVQYKMIRLNSDVYGIFVISILYCFNLKIHSMNLPQDIKFQFRVLWEHILNC